MRNRNYSKRVPPPVKGLFFLAMAALFFFVLGNVIMFLWNTILVKATGVNPLNFWESIGLFVLARILFGGFRFGPRSRAWRKRKWAWREKWRNMSEEEREEFKRKWKERCGK